MFPLVVGVGGGGEDLEVGWSSLIPCTPKQELAA